MREPKVGDIVLFVLDSGRHAGEFRPAIIVQVWTNDCVQLQVFADGNGDEDLNDGLPNVFWETSINHSSEYLYGTWHFVGE